MSETSDAARRGAGEGRPPGVPSDVVVGLVVLALCAVAYWITLGFEQAPAALARNVQPRTFPQLVIGLIAALTGLMMWRALRTGERKQRGPVPPMVPLTIAAVGVFVALFSFLGVFLAMATICVGLPLLWGERRYLALAAYAVLFPAAIYGLFVRVLDVRFPSILLPMLGL